MDRDLDPDPRLRRPFPCRSRIMSLSPPRSIHEYLQGLRAALAGADPALIQDALYDAEEHLRAEAAANPQKSVAELLDDLVRTYGTPEEVAAAYRDTDAKVTAALRPPVFRRDIA